MECKSCVHGGPTNHNTSSRRRKRCLTKHNLSGPKSEAFITDWRPVSLLPGSSRVAVTWQLSFLRATLAFDRSAPLKRCVQSHLGESLQRRHLMTLEKCDYFAACVQCLTFETVAPPPLLHLTDFALSDQRGSAEDWTVPSSAFGQWHALPDLINSDSMYGKTAHGAFTNETNNNIWPTAAGPEAEFGLTEGQLWASAASLSGQSARTHADMENPAASP